MLDLRCWTYDLSLPTRRNGSKADRLKLGLSGEKGAQRSARGHEKGLSAALRDGASRLCLLETLVDSTLAPLFAQQFIERKGNGERRERQSERRGSRCLE